MGTAYSADELQVGMKVLIAGMGCTIERISENSTQRQVDLYMREYPVKLTIANDLCIEVLVDHTGEFERDEDLTYNQHLEKYLISPEEAMPWNQVGLDDPQRDADKAELRWKEWMVKWTTATRKEMGI